MGPSVRWRAMSRALAVSMTAYVLLAVSAGRALSSSPSDHRRELGDVITLERRKRFQYLRHQRDHIVNVATRSIQLDDREWAFCQPLLMLHPLVHCDECIEEGIDHVK
jgi:hypothetical protein